MDIHKTLKKRRPCKDCGKPITEYARHKAACQGVPGVFLPDHRNPLCQCEVCGKQLSNKYSLMGHLRKKHQQEPSEEVKNLPTPSLEYKLCPVCHEYTRRLYRHKCQKEEGKYDLNITLIFYLISIWSLISYQIVINVIN